MHKITATIDSEMHSFVNQFSYNNHCSKSKVIQAALKQLQQYQEAAKEALRR
jgi:Arc/MetJ-type ribon-helix-helix transcriptional regulator